MARIVSGRLLHREEIPGFRERYQENVVELERLSASDRENKEKPLRFLNLHPDQTHLVDSVLRGRCDLADIPELSQRVVRLFVSATFTDMVDERTALMAQTYPKLKTYCRERYGVDFVAIDPRWGVRLEEIKDEHIEMDLYLKELHRCQEMSAGPDFAMFLGQKCSELALSSRINREEFEAMRLALKESEASREDDVTLLDTWFYRETNAVPNVYSLLPVECVPGAERRNWPGIKAQLRRILLETATICVASGQVNQGLLWQLQTPAVERELSEALVKIEDSDAYRKKHRVLPSRAERCMCFERTISDLTQYLDRAKVGKFIDLSPNTNCIDVKTHQSAWRLRNALHTMLGNDAIFHDSVTWRDPEGVDAHAHADYIERMCDEFYNRARDIVDRQMARRVGLVTDAFYEEIVQNWHIARRYCDTFIGRDALLEQVRRYIINDTNQALVIHGDTGTGKSALMAKAASLTQQWLVDTGRVISSTVAIRFCGASPDSNDIRRLLLNLSHQITYATNGYRHRIPHDFKRVKNYFRSLVQSGEIRGIIVLFIDGLDHLSSADDAARMDWLPSQVSQNVKIIVSADADSTALWRLRSKITNTERYYVHVKPLERAACFQVIMAGLARANRAITFAQNKAIKEAMTHTQSALFAKLTHERAARWTANDDVDKHALPTSIGASIEALLAAMESKHGEVFVRHALAYLTAARDGISESELLHLLSLDDDVMDAIFPTWSPAVRRMPTFPWLRLRDDISCDLVELHADETLVMCWCNRYFRQVAYSRYLDDRANREYIHGVMADYYEGVWCGMRRKPFGTDKEEPDTWFSEKGTVRYVPQQPFVYTIFTNKERPNVRKLNQWPHHLAAAGRIKQLYEDVLFNFEWLATKLRVCSVHGVLADYNLADAREVDIVADTLRMCESALAEDTNVLAVELTGRLLPFYSRHPNIRSLIDQCDQSAQTHCPLVPSWQTYTSPGGTLQYVCEAELGNGRQVDIQLVQNAQINSVLLTTKPIEGMVMHAWSVTSGERRPDLKLPFGSRVYPTPNGVFVNTFKDDDRVRTYRVDSREMVHEIKLDCAVQVGDIAVSDRYMALTLLQAASPIILDTQEGRQLERLRFRAHAIAISTDESHFVCNDEYRILLHRMPLMERRCTAQAPDLPAKIVSTSDNCRYYILFRNKQLVAYRFNVIQKRAATNRILVDMETRDFRLSHAQDRILVRCSRRMYLIDASRTPETVIHDICQMPDGVFVDRLSTFTDAAFVSDDSMVVASRHTYVCLWRTATGLPLRVLQSSVSPVRRLLTCDITNVAVTVLADSTMQVWNLNNTDSCIPYIDAVVKGAVVSLDVATDAACFICTGRHLAEARIVDMATGECEHVLEHSSTIGAYLNHVKLSPHGGLAITSVMSQGPWPLLREDKLWHVETGRLLKTVPVTRYVVLGPHDVNVVFFQCQYCNAADWSLNAYSYLCLNVDSGNMQRLEVPDGDVISEPFFTLTGSYLVFLQQEKFGLDAEQEARGADARYEIRMCVHSLGRQWRGTHSILLHELWSNAADDAILVDARPFGDDSIIVIYGSGTTFFRYRADGKVDRSTAANGALIYDVRKDSVLKRIDGFPRPYSDVERVAFSRQMSFALDSTNRLYEIITGRLITALDIGDVISPDTVQLIIDGRYVAALSANKRELLVFRSTDGQRKARVFVHAVATCIRVGADDRTLLVGCDDGRVMVFTVVLGVASHVHDIVRHLASRRRHLNTSPAQSLVLSSDVKKISTTVNEHRQMTALSTRRITQSRLKPPSFKSVATAVMITQQTHRARSQACCIQ